VAGCWIEVSGSSLRKDGGRDCENGNKVHGLASTRPVLAKSVKSIALYLTHSYQRIVGVVSRHWLLHQLRCFDTAILFQERELGNDAYVSVYSPPMSRTVPGGVVNSGGAGAIFVGILKTRRVLLDRSLLEELSCGLM
jgi:hypothetical protein